jgi:hypothetical protein
VRVSDGDAFPLDDVVYLDRGPSEVTVRLAGRRHEDIRRALERNPRVRLLTGGSPDIVVRVGEAAQAGDPEAQVLVDPPGGGEAVLGEPEPADHPILRSVRGDELRLAGMRVVTGGTPLVSVGGRPVAAVEGRRVVFGAEFPPEAGDFPSFPILWANVIDFLAPGPSWLVRRTREPVDLADGRKVRAQRVGANRIDGAVVHANLLDRAASEVSGEARPFERPSLPAAPEARGRRSLAAWPCAAALALVLAAWWLERKR